jgi:hypothetical protein
VPTLVIPQQTVYCIGDKEPLLVIQPTVLQIHTALVLVDVQETHTITTCNNIMKFYNEVTFLSEDIITGSVYQMPFGTGSKDVVVEAVVGIDNGVEEEIYVCYYYNDSSKQTVTAIGTNRKIGSKYVFDDLGTFYQLRYPNSPVDVRYITGSNL